MDPFLYTTGGGPECVCVAWRPQVASLPEIATKLGTGFWGGSW